MSEWITDRRPTEADADYEKCVWTMCVGKVVLWRYKEISDGWPWMRTNRPKPYVKPKRWLAVWSNVRRMWTLRNTSYSDPDVHAYNIGLVCLDYLSKQDEHREAAERIAAIYEEVMP